MPNGSTYWNHICYYILGKFDSPDGSTYCGLKYYNILVNFDHPDGSTSWGYMYIIFQLNLTLQMPICAVIWMVKSN